MKMKTISPQTIRLANGRIDEIEEFTYLWNVVSTTSGSDRDVEARLGIARAAFQAMDRLEVKDNWKSDKDQDI